ncbi:hypothetical protein D3C80_1578650 [compost metagenome]
MGFDLQDVVGEVGHIADVAKHVVDAIFKKLWRHELIALGQGFQGIGIDEIVELEDRTIDAFPRIIFRGGLGGKRNQQRTGAHTKPSERIAPAHRKTPWTVTSRGAWPGAKIDSIRRNCHFRQYWTRPPSQGEQFTTVSLNCHRRPLASRLFQGRRHATRRNHPANRAEPDCRAVRPKWLPGGFRRLYASSE